MDECIGGVQSTQFLGVGIDCHLNWSKLFKDSKGIGIINRIKQSIL